MDDYNTYIKRAQNYKNLYDASTGFMRPKSGNFLTPFDPYKVDHNYTEGNAWQYSFYIPQDISGHIKLLGGKEKLAEKLDSLFTTSSKLTGHKQPDITGLIGQYVHGNEPSHQIAYEYDYAAQPWKTQAMIRRILTEMYHDLPDGLSGNEDCGQMSAWYVFSAMGFYPVCPGSDHYAIGSPNLDNATMHLENGKTFTVKAAGNSKDNLYIQSATLNGAPYNKSFITYETINNGGVLEFQMGNTPNKNWGSGEGNFPVTTIE
jgi:predicted alpha-1,2-mannosidase